MGTSGAPEEEVGTAGVAGEEAWMVGCLHAETAGAAVETAVGWKLAAAEMEGRRQAESRVFESTR